MGPMNAVQQVDAVTRRVEPMRPGWLLSLGRVLPGRPREVWRAWATPSELALWWGEAVEPPEAWAPGAELVDASGVRHRIEQCQEPELVRLVLRDGERESFVALDLAVDGGQSVLTLQHALPEPPAGAGDQAPGPAAALTAQGLAWDRRLWRLARHLEDRRGEADDAPAREAEAEQAASQLWAVALQQAGVTA